MFVFNDSKITIKRANVMFTVISLSGYDHVIISVGYFYIYLYVNEVGGTNVKQD